MTLLWSILHFITVKFPKDVKVIKTEESLRDMLDVSNMHVDKYLIERKTFEHPDQPTRSQSDQDHLYSVSHPIIQSTLVISNSKGLF